MERQVWRLADDADLKVGCSIRSESLSEWSGRSSDRPNIA
jgi:hypothetical protein